MLGWDMQIMIKYNGIKYKMKVMMKNQDSCLMNVCMDSTCWSCWCLRHLPMVMWHPRPSVSTVPQWWWATCTLTVLTRQQERHQPKSQPPLRSCWLWLFHNNHSLPRYLSPHQCELWGKAYDPLVGFLNVVSAPCSGMCKRHCISANIFEPLTVC